MTVTTAIAIFFIAYFVLVLALAIRIAIKKSNRNEPPPALRDVPCVAIRHSDLMVCNACGLAWDASDEHRPPCAPRRNPGGYHFNQGESGAK